MKYEVPSGDLQIAKYEIPSGDLPQLGIPSGDSFYFNQYEKRGPIWRPSNGETRDPFWRSSSTWNPIGRFLITKTDIDVVLSFSDGRVQNFSFSLFFLFFSLFQNPLWFKTVILCYHPLWFSLSLQSCWNALRTPPVMIQKKHTCNDLWLDAMHAFVPGFET